MVERSTTEELIEDVASHHDLGIGVEHVALDFEMAEDPLHRDLMTWDDPSLGETVSRYFKVPLDGPDLLNRREMIERSTRLGRRCPTYKRNRERRFFALDLVTSQMDNQLGTEYRKRVGEFIRTCKKKDLSLAVAQTDVKGDRSLLPSQQEHPDYYVHIVEERPDGIVVRGAKAHTTCAPYVDELVVLPTRAFKEDDAAYAVSFAILLTRPELNLLQVLFGSPPANAFHHPVSSGHRMIDTLTIFDDVFIPNERIF